MARRARIAMVLLPLAAAGVLGIAVSSIARSNISVATASSELPAARQNDRPMVVAGSGIVEPAGREIAIATSVQGVVRQVPVKPGEAVKQGDVLFVIESAVAMAVLDQRRQDLGAAERRLGQTIARIPQLRADIEAARASVKSALAERDEAADQVNSGAAIVRTAIPERELTRRRNALRSAEGRLSEARARLDSSLAALLLNDPEQKGANYLADQQAVAQASSAITLAEAERDRLTVRSPRDAMVLAVNIRPGEFASQGTQTPPVVLGASSPLQVRVDIDEADLPRLSIGTPATASRRGARSERIMLTFVRAEPIVTAKRSLTGGSDERVDTRVLQLIYEVTQTEVELRPGQLLDIRIEVSAQSPVTGG